MPRGLRLPGKSSGLCRRVSFARRSHAQLSLQCLHPRGQPSGHPDRTLTSKARTW